MQRLGRDHVVALVRRDATAPGQIGAGLPDVGGVEVSEAAVEQRGRQVLRFGRVAVEQGDGLVQGPYRFGPAPRPHEKVAALDRQDTAVSGRDEAPGPVQEAQSVFGAALLGFPYGQDHQQPGGQGLMRGVYPLRIGPGAVLGPAELPQPRADIAGADRGTTRVSLPQAALTRLPGPALGPGQRGSGTGGAEPGGWQAKSVTVAFGVGLTIHVSFGVTICCCVIR